MPVNRRTTLAVDLMETRALLSGLGHAPIVPSDAAVKADLARIKADNKALVTDIKTMAPTLKADQVAINAAIKSASRNDPNVQSAQATLTAEIKATQSTIKADLAAIKAASTPTARQAAYMHLQGDATSLDSSNQADEAALQSAVDQDAGVVAARAKLNTDEMRIATDQATLKADYTRLSADLKAEYSQ